MTYHRNIFSVRYHHAKNAKNQKNHYDEGNATAGFLASQNRKIRFFERCSSDFSPKTRSCARAVLRQNAKRDFFGFLRPTCYSKWGGGKTRFFAFLRPSVYSKLSGGKTDFSRSAFRAFGAPRFFSRSDPRRRRQNAMVERSALAGRPGDVVS